MDSTRSARSAHARWRVGVVGGALAVLIFAGAGIALARPAPTYTPIRVRVETVASHVRRERIPERRSHPDPDGYARLVSAVAEDRVVGAGERAAAAVVRYVGADWARHHRPAWSRYRSPIANPGQAHPFAPPDPGCYADAFAREWHGNVAWAQRTARGESGCSVTAYNPRPCNRAGTLHAAGILQQCGYSGPLTADAEIASAWGLCLAQIDAWSYHGNCR